MNTLDDLISRLEIRRMESAAYKARWCTCCFRTELREPFVMLHSGDGGKCHQPIQTGTISECITSFHALRCDVVQGSTV